MSARHHWIAGSGCVGCLYDYGPNAHTSKANAIADLWFMFSDSLSPHDARHMRAALRRDGIYYFKDQISAGAHYCEVSKANGPCPELGSYDPALGR